MINNKRLSHEKKFEILEALRNYIQIAAPFVHWTGCHIPVHLY